MISGYVRWRKQPVFAVHKSHASREDAGDFDAFWKALIGRPTAGNIECRGGGERTFFACQPTYQGSAFGSLPQPSDWDARTHIIDLTLRHLVEYRALKG